MDEVLYMKSISNAADARSSPDFNTSVQHSDLSDYLTEGNRKGTSRVRHDLLLTITILIILKDKLCCSMSRQKQQGSFQKLVF